MNNYVSILDCIDEINDVVAATEYSVASAMAHSYLKTNKLFAECYERGKDPCDIYQEASVMDEVKDKAKNDKNGFVTFFKFVPRLIIAIINKIKNKLLNKNKGDISVKASTVEKVNKELSKKKTGTMMLAGGLVLAAGATGGILIYKKRPNGKSNQKEDHGVKVEVTKNAKVKTNVDVEAMQKDVIGLMQELNNLTHRVTDDEEVIVKLREDMARFVIDKTKALKAEIAEIKNKPAVYEVNGNFNQNNQEIADRLTNLEKEISQVKGDLEEQKGDLALKLAEVLSAGPEAINEAMQALIEIAEEVEALKKQGTTGSGPGSSSQEPSNENTTDVENLKKFVDTVKNKLPDIKNVVDDDDDYDGISKAIDESYKTLEGLTNEDSDENLDKEHKILYDIHSAINSMCKGTSEFSYIPDRKAGGFKQSDVAKVIEKFLADVGYRKMTDEFKVGNDFKGPYNKQLYEWFGNVDNMDMFHIQELGIQVKPGQIAIIGRYPYILDLDKLKLKDTTKNHLKKYKEQGMFIIKGDKICQCVENSTV